LVPFKSIPAQKALLPDPVMIATRLGRKVRDEVSRERKGKGKLQRIFIIEPFP
jgi:hypothetical protein